MIGKRIGPYEVVSKLGEGGMGEVYQAKQQYAVSRDGRFLLDTTVETATPPITIVMNWTSRLATRSSR